MRDRQAIGLAAAAAERRRTAGEAFFEAEAERIARLCHRMAERFAQGGRLVAFGEGPVARSDARHVAVEFVHPVIVGKRALPALALTAEGGPLLTQVELLVEPADIALAFGDHPDTVAAIGVARERGCLTLAASHVGAEWEIVPTRHGNSDDNGGDDPFVGQELVETLYHVLWELVHVFLEHPGLLEGHSGPGGSRSGGSSGGGSSSSSSSSSGGGGGGGGGRTVHDSGASSFLYPFLGKQEDDLEGVLADVRASVLAKSVEVAALREQTLHDGERELHEAARALRARLDAGGRVLALGNGGSATDAMDAVADLRFPPTALRSRAAIDLTEDPGILTAIANDVGVESIFSRQVIAHGRSGDVLLAFSTSGGSVNVLAALAEARRREIVTVALVGYDGGRIAAEGLADHVIVTRSEHIPRIQEAQASAWHVLRELVEDEGSSIVETAS